MFLPVTSFTVANTQESSTTGPISVWAGVTPQIPPVTLPSRGANGGAAGSKDTFNDVLTPGIIGPVLLTIPSNDAFVPIISQCGSGGPLSRGELAGLIVGIITPVLIFTLCACLSVRTAREERKKRMRGESTELSGNRAGPIASGPSLAINRGPTAVQRPRLRLHSTPKNAIPTGPAKQLLQIGAPGMGALTPAGARSRSQTGPTVPQAVYPKN